MKKQTAYRMKFTLSITLAFALVLALFLAAPPVRAVSLTAAYGGDPVSVIVLFAHEPEEVREARAMADGYFLPQALAGVQAEADHQLFRRELAAMFGVSALGSADEPYSITREYRYAINGAAVTLPAGYAAGLSAFESVMAVFPDEAILLSPPDTGAALEPLVRVDGNPYGMSVGRAAMHADDMHNEGFRGEGVLVAVVDTGVDYNHPAFAGAFPALEQIREFNPGITEADTIDGIFYGRNFKNDASPNDPMDTPGGVVPGHGTHVAGIVAGRDTGEMYSILGIAPEAMITAYRVMGPSGGTQADLLAAIDTIMLDKPDVVNLSIGVRFSTPLCVVALAVNNAMLVHPHMNFIAAAGNDGSQGQYTISSPGTSVKAITVGSADNSMKLSNFSSRGPMRVNHEIAPDLTAHGYQVWSARPAWVGGVGYNYMSGSSAAAPHVAGAAALLIEYSRTMGREWRSEEIKARLMNAAIPMEDCGVFETGAGYTNVHAAAQSKAVVYSVNNRIPTSPKSYEDNVFGSGFDGTVNFDGFNRTKYGKIVNSGSVGKTFTFDCIFTINPGAAASLQFSGRVFVPANGQAPFSVAINAGKADAGIYEGYIHVTEGGVLAARLPFALVAHEPNEGYTAEELAIIAEWEAGWGIENLSPEDAAFVVAICPVRNPENHAWWNAFQAAITYWYDVWNTDWSPDEYVPRIDVEAWLWGMMASWAN